MEHRAQPTSVHADAFTEYRPLLFTIAYQILGSAADAEDVLQDSYIRYSRTDPDEIGAPRAFLARLVSRQALNQLRTLERRREDYIGPWLPEPIRTEPDAGTNVELAESVSVAMLLILETLNPTERAVFVLREAFGYSHDEVADMLGKTADAVRQIAHRARDHVRTRRRRFEPASSTARLVVGRFFDAANNGDVQALMSLMAPDVVQLSDGGGRVTAARKPVCGAERVATFIVGLARKGIAPDIRVEPASFNMAPAAMIYSGDRLDSVLTFEVVDGLVHRLYAVRNPEKLRLATSVRELGDLGASR